MTNDIKSEGAIYLYGVLPAYSLGDSVDNIDPLERLYYNNYLLDKLAGAHQFLPIVQFQYVSIKEIISGRFKCYPEYVDFNDIVGMMFESYKEISAIREDLSTVNNINEIIILDKKRKSLKNEIQTLLPEHQKINIVDMELNIDGLLKDRHSENIEKSESDITNRKILIAILETRSELFSLSDIKTDHLNSLQWLEELIYFLKFLLDNKLELATNLEINDFLIKKEGEIEVFLSPWKLIKSDKNDSYLTSDYLSKLAKFVFDVGNKNYLLFNNSKYYKIYGRLNYNTEGEGSTYTKLDDVLIDIHTKFENSHEKKIAVFLDYANMFTVIENLKLDLKLLLFKIYGAHEYYKIKNKVAVLFQPVFKDKLRNDKSYEKLIDAEVYLNEFGFKAEYASNGLSYAKTVENGLEYDVDDQMLIELIKQSYSNYDSICILSGDGHFKDIAVEIMDSGIEVIFVSTTQEDTSNELMERFDVYLFEDYMDCFYFNN